MAVQELGFGVRPLFRSFQSARRWLWLQRGIKTLAIALCASGIFATAASALSLFQAPAGLLSWLWTACYIAPAAGLLAALLSRPSESLAVRTVDARLGLDQRLGTAHELLTRGSPSALVPWQLSQASDLAAETPVSRAFPLLPKREVAAAALLFAVATAMLWLMSLGVTLKNPFQEIRMPASAAKPATPPERQLFGKTVAAEAAGPKSPALDPTRQMLSQIERQAQRGALSSAAAASALQQASAELNRAAQNSASRQQALDNLSAQLRGTAAGADAAQSLRQGDYQKAVQQLKELGQQSDELSAAAKDQLAQALSQAASQSQSLPQLSRAENQAAQALRRSDSAYVGNAMNRLAQAVDDTGKQVVSQSDLAQTWQQLSDLSKQLAGTDQSSARSAAQAPPAAQSAQGAGEKSSSQSQAAASSNDQNPGDPMAGAMGQNTGQSPAGGQPGNTPGGPPMGDPNQIQGADGKSLELSGKVGGNFPQQSDPSNEQPSIMREGDASSASSGSDQPGGAATSAPAENVFVPGDRRAIVRDYFSDSGKGAGSQ